jgi:hypothetical protein
MVGIAFVAFIIAWAVYPFLNTRTILHPQASAGFKARTVDLSSIRVSDLQSEVAGVAVNKKGEEISSKKNETQSYLTKIIKPKSFAAQDISGHETDINNNRYTPSVLAAGAKEKDKGYLTEGGGKDSKSDEKTQSDNEVSSAAADGKPAAGGASSGSSENLRRNFFGKKKTDAKLEKSEIPDKIKIEKDGDNEVYARLKLAAKTSKLASDLSDLDARKEVGRKAFEDMTDKNLKVGMDEYERLETSESIKVKDNLVSKTLSGASPVKQGSIQFPPIPEPDDLEKQDWQMQAELDDLERRLAEGDVSKDQWTALLIQVGLAVLLGPVLGLTAGSAVKTII